MALVDYPSSDDSDARGGSGNGPTTSSPATKDLKRKREPTAADLPPLPSKFHDLYASAARVSTRDDPSLHGGRKRVTPHVDGNWPAHIYIEWIPITAEYDSLVHLIAAIQDGETAREGTRLHSLLTSDLGAPLPLHISLSSPIGFRTEKRDGFVSSLQQSIAGCGVKPFDVSPISLDWVPNFEKTRWFLVLRLRNPPCEGLNKLLRVCNRVVEEHGQPPLYAKPSQEPTHDKTGKREIRLEEEQSAEEDFSDSFHVSIGWALDAPNLGAARHVRTVSNEQIFNAVKDARLSVDEIKVKVGNVITSVQLPLKVLVASNIFGL